MHAQSCIADRLRVARESAEYTQTGIAVAVGSKLRSWQEYEAGNRMPGGAVFQGVAKLGINVNWLLTGEGPMRADEIPATQTGAEAATVNEGVLADVISVLREREQLTGRRFPPDREARLIVEIYQYIIEDEAGPTPEDRAKVLKLVASIIGGTTDARERTKEGDD